MKNALTKTEALVIELCHHGLRGLSVVDAAKEMRVKPHTIRFHLRNAEVKAPNLFPILTPTQAKVLHLYNVEGHTVSQIAMMRDVSVNSVRGILSKLRKKGVLDDDRPKRPVSFNEQVHSDKVMRKW